jgi:hypothetical protein
LAIKVFIAIPHLFMVSRNSSSSLLVGITLAAPDEDRLKWQDEQDVA